MAQDLGKVLIVDDEQDILDLLSFNLVKEGFQVITSKNGEDALRAALRERPDLVVLDIMLPGFSGIEVLKRLKHLELTRKTPVMMLTAKNEEVDRVLGFELGAEDYITKPFSVRELVLRTRAMLARLKAPSEPPQLLRCGAIVLDLSGHSVVVEELPIQLTSTEFNLLAYLMQNAGRVVSRDQLLNRVWGYVYSGSARTVDTHMQRLRDKLGKDGDCIQTIRGFGYKLGPGPPACLTTRFT